MVLKKYPRTTQDHQNNELRKLRMVTCLGLYVKTKDKVMNSSNQHLSLQRQYEVNMIKFFFEMVNMIKYYAPKVMQLAMMHKEIA